MLGGEGVAERRRGVGHLNPPAAEKPLEILRFRIRHGRV